MVIWLGVDFQRTSLPPSDRLHNSTIWPSSSNVLWAPQRALGTTASEMCNDKYVEFICGHRKMVSSLCDYAIAVDTPFWIRIACEQYTHESYKSPKGCGFKGAHCSTGKDGAYLEDLYKEMCAGTAELNTLKADFARHKVVRDNFHKSADDAGVSHESRMTHPKYGLIQEQEQRLLNKRGRLQAILTRLSSSIAEVKQYYAVRGAQQSLLTNRNTIASFVDQFGRRYFTNSPKTLSVTNVNLPFPSQQMPVNGANAAQQHTLQPSRALGQTLIQSTHGSKGALDTRGRPTYAGNQNMRAPIKRERKSASPVKQESPEQKPTIRRSARVSNRKINYAESSDVEASSSRAASPGESDVSGFSPSRSDASGSAYGSQPGRRGSRPPLKREDSGLSNKTTSRGGSSLVTRIGQWKAQNNRMPFPLANRVNYESGVPNSTKLEANTEHLQSMYHVPDFLASTETGHPLSNQGSTAQLSEASARPPTRHGPPAQQQANRGVGHTAQQPPPAIPNFLTSHPMHPFQPNHPTEMTQANANELPDTPEVQQNQTTSNPDIAQPMNVQLPNSTWLINTPIPPATAADDPSTFPQDPNPNTAPPAIPPGRNDPNPTNPPPESFYSRMARSFNATADFTPPNTTNTPPSTDPRKRKVPASSPLLSKNKHPRLSFPGDSQPDITALDQTLPTSSPPKMPSQALPEDGNQSASPAPNLRPEAVMVTPGRGQVTVEFESPYQMSEEEANATDWSAFFFGEAS